MKFSILARAVVGIAVVMTTGLMAGCSGNDRPTDALDQPLAVSLSTSAPRTGSAAAKGAELTAVAVVRGWISARNSALGSDQKSAVDALSASECGTCRDFLRGARWSVSAARVSQHTVDTATVETLVSSSAAEDLVLEFDVARVDGAPVVTRIVVAS